MSRGQRFYSHHYFLWHHYQFLSQGLWGAQIFGAARRARFLGGWRKNSDELEGNNHCWYLATVLNNGSYHVTQMYNLLSNVWNQNRGRVLAEPFPLTVIQGVILVFIIVNSQL